MEQEKKLATKAAATNNLTRLLEIQNEHNLILGDCLALLKKSMVNLYGDYATDGLCKSDELETREGTNSLVERLGELNSTRGYLINEIHTNLRSMLGQSEIQN
jgi:hypothetical protein